MNRSVLVVQTILAILIFQCIMLVLTAVQLSLKETIFLAVLIAAQVFAIGLFYFVFRKPWNGTVLKLEHA